MYDFVIQESPNHPVNEPSDALWSFIPVLYEKAAEGSCVATVVNAVAYVNFANRCHAPQAEAMGEEALGRAMVMLSKMIADKKQAVSDEALCSVYLMGVYEVRTVLSGSKQELTSTEHQLPATPRNIHRPPERSQRSSQHAVDRTILQ